MKARPESHRRLWRIVDGALKDVLNAHPDYFTERGREAFRPSAGKRVVGQLVGHADQVRKDGPLGASRNEDRILRPSSGRGATTAPRSRRPGLSTLLTGGQS